MPERTYGGYATDVLRVAFAKRPRSARAQEETLDIALKAVPEMVAHIADLERELEATRLGHQENVLLPLIAAAEPLGWRETKQPVHEFVIAKLAEALAALNAVRKSEGFLDD